MKVLVFDTETSDMPKWNWPSEHPAQPHVCQFTAEIFDSETGEEIEYVDLEVLQEWPVAPEALAVHGITKEHSRDYGVPEAHVANHFETMVAIADQIAGFSIDFDIRIMRICMLRHGRPKVYCDEVNAKIQSRKFDIKNAVTAQCRIPPTSKMMASGRRTWKTPTLVEATKILLKEDMTHAHDAREDLLATVKLWKFLHHK